MIDFDKLFKYKDRSEKRKSKYKSSLGWGSDSSTSEYWGDFLYRRSVYSSSRYSAERIDKVTELISRAMKTTRDMIVILDFPHKLRIVLNQNDYYSGNSKEGRLLFLPTKIFDDKKISEDDRINIFCGQGIHESLHLMYSEYRVINYLSENWDTLFKYSSIVKLLGNIIEDERVEDRLLRERPGFLVFIEKSKRYTTDQLENNFSNIDNDNDLTIFLKLLVKFIRFPEFLDIDGSERIKNLIDEKKDLFNDLQDIISEDLPINTKESFERAGKLVDVLENHINLVNEFEYNSIPRNFVAQAENIAYYNINSGFDCENDSLRISSDLISDDIKSNEIISKLVLGKAEKGEGKNVYFQKTSGNQLKYLSVVDSIKPMIPSIRKIVSQTDKNYTFNVYGCRSGILDTNKLAEAYQGVPQVYVRQGIVKTNKTTVCVLLDESGSMNWNNKDKRAKEAAVLLNEALGNIPGIDLYIYGHTADTICIGCVDIMIYREGNIYNPKFSLSEVSAKKENRDGLAIYEVAKRVRKYTNNRCLFFVISDGTPCANDYWGSEARDDTREYVEKAEKLDFDIIQVSIDKVEGVEDMFTKYIDISSENISDLPKKLNKIIKEAVLNDKKTTVI